MRNTPAALGASETTAPGSGDPGAAILMPLPMLVTAL